MCIRIGTSPLPSSLADTRSQKKYLAWTRRQANIQSSILSRSSNRVGANTRANHRCPNVRIDGAKGDRGTLIMRTRRTVTDWDGDVCALWTSTRRGPAQQISTNIFVPFVLRMARVKERRRWRRRREFDWLVRLRDFGQWWPTRTPPGKQVSPSPRFVQPFYAY